jgi:hypothetical protein
MAIDTLSHNILHIITENAQKYKHKKRKNPRIGGFFGDQESGIKDQGLGIEDQGSGIKDQGSRIRGCRDGSQPSAFLRQAEDSYAG